MRSFKLPYRSTLQVALLIGIWYIGTLIQVALSLPISGGVVGLTLLLISLLAVRVVNMRFVKPLDEKMITTLAPSTALFVTVEEHAVMAGAGSAVNEYLAQAQIVKPMLNLGLADTFMHQATHAQMLHQAGLDAEGIESSVRQAWSKLVHMV